MKLGARIGRAIAVVVTWGVIVTLVSVKTNRPAEPEIEYSEAIGALSYNGELQRQVELKRQEELKRQADHIAEMIRESRDRFKCFAEAELATVGIVKDELFSAESAMISAKVKQDDLVEACMLAKGWPKKWTLRQTGDRE
jgi:hypothetical protein